MATLSSGPQQHPSLGSGPEHVVWRVAVLTLGLRLAQKRAANEAPVQEVLVELDGISWLLGGVPAAKPVHGESTTSRVRWPPMPLRVRQAYKSPRIMGLPRETGCLSNMI